MGNNEEKDIFISYRNDGASEQFASRLNSDLTAAGYSVYYNPEEKRQKDFREKIRNAVMNCTDFVLIVSNKCLEILKENRETDWVRYEIVTAHENGKNFIPILMKGAEMPSSAEGFPEELHFLPYIDAISFPDNYRDSPFAKLVGDLVSRRSNNLEYRKQFADNTDIDICDRYKKALEQAKSGDVKAMYEIACMYYWGIGGESQSETKVDYGSAAFWLKKIISECDDPELVSSAQGLLGRLYYRGLVPGESQSYEKAYKCQQVAAEHNRHALAELSYLIRTGCGCEYDYNKIVDFLDGCMDQLNNQEIMGAARYFASVGQYQKAKELFESVEYMTPEMKFELGMLYKKGVTDNPPRPNLYKAEHYLRDAADANNLSAVYQLGLLYFNPTGDKSMKDFNKAQSWFTKGAKAGHSQCQYILGFMYKFGHVEKDFDKAIYWLEKAVAQGSIDAAIELVVIYWSPEHCNYRRAFECAEMSAMAGIPEGELLYGVSLLLGRGCRNDVYRAKEWLRKAKEHGVSYAGIL